MSSIFKSILKRGLNSGAGVRLLHAVYGQGPRILTYHRFPESSLENFARQCEFLAQQYRPVPLDEIVTAVAEQRPLPRRAVAITIDDGYLDVFEHAAPILRRYGIPATVYVVPGFLDGAFWMWWDRIAHAFQSSPLTHAELRLPGRDPARVELGDRDRRKHLAGSIAAYFARSGQAVAEQLCRSLAEDLSVTIPEDAPSAYRPMSWQQARELTGQGFTIGSHSMTHPVMGTVAEYEAKQSEAVRSRDRILEKLDKPVRHFCFPNGGIGDFSYVDIDVVRLAGYHSAATTIYGMIFPNTDPFQLPRINSDPTMRVSDFRSLIAGRLYLTPGINVTKYTRLEI